LDGIGNSAKQAAVEEESSDDDGEVCVIQEILDKRYFSIRFSIFSTTSINSSESQPSMHIAVAVFRHLSPCVLWTI
jgi:hypothetical protein